MHVRVNEPRQDGAAPPASTTSEPAVPISDLDLVHDAVAQPYIGQLNGAVIAQDAPPHD